MTRDICIAGCGIAGAVAGLTALKQGAHVCIIEKNKKELIGRKVCGELITQKALTFLKKEFSISVDKYLLKGLEFVSSSGFSLYVPEPLCTIDRHALGQALLNAVVDNSGEVVCETVKAPLGNTYVKGVKTQNSAYPSTVTIDCSGAAAVLRRTFISFHPEPLGVAYKENIILKEPIHTEYAKIIFDKKLIPSGYVWCFQKSEYELNVGAGGLVRGTIPFKEILKKVLGTLDIKIRKRENPGFGVVPLGRPLPSLVYPGLLVCGDAAHHVNPLTGEGIAPAVTAGYYAGKTAADAVITGNVSVEGLWRYNTDFAREYGIAHTSLIAARNFLVSLSDEELDYFMQNIVTGEDISNLIKGIIPDDKRKMIKIFLNNWRRTEFLSRLYSVFRIMNKIKALYRAYPETADKFSPWQYALDSLMEKC